MRTVLFLPAAVVTLGAVVLTAVFAVIPAVSTTEYLEIERGANSGDLAILGDVEAGSLVPGDLVAARFVDRPAQPYVVVGAQEGAVLLATESGDVVILAPVAAVGRRVTDTVGGLGSLYGFVDQAAGWGTVAAATVAIWLLTLLGLRTLGRRPERAFASAERALSAEQASSAEPEWAAPAERDALPEPVDIAEAAPAPEPKPEPVLMPEGDSREPIPFPAPSAVRVASSIDDWVLELAGQVARQAPQAGLRHVRRVTELSTRKQTLGWAGLAATAAAVAAATYLVASERTQKKVPKRTRRSRR